MTLRPKEEEVTEVWRKLHNEELRDLHRQYIIRVIVSRKIRWSCV
jgi:hypothetical protein